MRRSKKLFKYNTRLVNCSHAIPLANFQSGISCPVNNHIRDVHSLELGIQRSGDVRDPEKFFCGGEYSRDQVLRMVCRIIEDILALHKFVGHQLTVVFLEVSEHVCYGVVDGVCCAISGIRKIRLLNHGDDFLHKSLLKYCHFSK